MKKAILVLTGAIAAAGTYYISSTPYQPKNEQVQGALGARRLANGAKVCVNKIQNRSGIDDDLIAQLSNAGFKAAATGRSEAACASSVYGEIVALKGKYWMEAEVEFRLVIAADQTPFISSIAKGKSREQAAPAASPVSGVVRGFIAPAKRGSDLESTPVVTRQAVNAAFRGCGQADRAATPVADGPRLGRVAG